MYFFIEFAKLIKNISDDEFSQYHASFPLFFEHHKRLGEKWKEYLEKNEIKKSDDKRKKWQQTIREIRYWEDQELDYMYGKIMSINDSMILKYYKLAVFADREKIKEVKLLLNDNANNPRDIKRSLAKELVKKYYSEEKADLAQSSFDQIFVKRDNPENMQSRKIDSDVGLLELLTEEGLIASKGEGKRLLSQNAVKINGEVCNDINLIVSPSNEELVIKVGKRRFLKVTS